MEGENLEKLFAEFFEECISFLLKTNEERTSDTLLRNDALYGKNTVGAERNVIIMIKTRLKDVSGVVFSKKSEEGEETAYPRLPREPLEFLKDVNSTRYRLETCSLISPRDVSVIKVEILEAEKTILESLGEGMCMLIERW